MVASYGAVLYNVWQARNGKIFRGQAVNIGFLVQLIQAAVKERVDMYRGAKTARKCVSYIDRICM